MKLSKNLALLGLLLGLGACASFPGDPHPGKTEQVGILLADNCNSAGCDFTLLDEDMESPLAQLEGNIDSSLQGRLIAVLGQALPEVDGVPVIQVERNHSITEFDYRPFFAQAVPATTQREFGCVSLWDQSYAWRLDGRQPVLIATLRNPLETGQRLRLEFDGLNQALMASSIPGYIDPCRLR